MENKLETPFLQIDSTHLPPGVVTKHVKACEVEYNIWRTIDPDETDAAIGKYSSVVLSHPEGQVLCYTPPKSVSSETFMGRYPEICGGDLFANDAIEGTLISLFWDERLDKWEIATKGAIGGNYWFYRTKYPGIHENMAQSTFRDMFLDALGSMEVVNDDMDDLPKLRPRSLVPNERICYNFVLQHPENHIVFDIEMPALYLVSVYSICENEIRIVPREEYVEWVQTSLWKDVIHFPREYAITDWLSVDKHNYLMGLMVTHKNGDRTCIENPQYLTRRELRGNHPNLQYHFLDLIQKGMNHTFLVEFPRYAELFYYFYILYENFITGLHNLYVSYYVKKSNILIPKPYFCIIHHLHHTVYVPSLATTKVIMKRTEFEKYVQTLSPKQLMYLLNYRE
jgi:hypothetical protein|uniref:Uncharacterized protein n=1 Tax=viral metagenome TaxID=1070528 RepID=A0A6C0DY42_9ZZZZ